MTAPTVGNFATALYEAVAPLSAEDASHGYALLYLCESFGTMFEDPYNWIIEDADETRPGWSIIMDLDECPDDALDWIAQFKGARLVSTWDAATKRAYILSSGGADRGKPSAIVAAVQTLLTGTKSVVLRERYNVASPGDDTDISAGFLYVQTLTSETPDAAAIQALLDGDLVVPAGIIATHEDVAVRDFDDLDADYASFTAVDTAYDSFDELLGDL